MKLLAALVLAAFPSASASALQRDRLDYSEFWQKAQPFDRFLEATHTRAEQWRSRFANAAVDAAVLNDLRALSERRRILVVAEERCSDSAWTVPYLAKLAAAVPERLELRIIAPRDGARVQAAHQAPDGRRATPTVVVLDEQNRLVGAWVERPAALRQWVREREPRLSADELHDQIDAWYSADEGRSTVHDIVSLLKQPARGGGQ